MDDEIGVKLLDRSNNRVALTEEGRLFLFESKKLLAMCAKSVAAVQRTKCGENSVINIGCVANIHYGLPPTTLEAFRKLHPGVALNLFDMTSAEQFLAIVKCEEPQMFSRQMAKFNAAAKLTHTR